MALGYEIKRGDVYYVRFDKSFGHELSAGRPAVVISADNIEKVFPMFTCVFTTTTDQNHVATSIPLTTMPKKSWALCNQLYSFDECRIKDYMCTLSDEEMARIDAGLGIALGLNLHDEEYRKEQEAKHQVEMAALKASHEKELAAVRAEITGKEVEFEVYKRLYDRALDELVAMKMDKDFAAKAAPVEPKVAEPVSEKPESVVEAADDRVDINRCSLGALTELGFTMSVAKMIQAARPFLSTEDLKSVSGVTRIAYQLVEKRITVGDTAEFRKPKPKSEKPVAVKPKTEPVKPKPASNNGERVNVNTATWAELAEKAGLSEMTAKYIVAYRNKWGKFTAVEDLLNVKRFGKTCLKKYGDKLTV